MWSSWSRSLQRIAKFHRGKGPKTQWSGHWHMDFEYGCYVNVFSFFFEQKIIIITARIKLDSSPCCYSSRVNAKMKQIKFHIYSSRHWTMHFMLISVILPGANKQWPVYKHKKQKFQEHLHSHLFLFKVRITNTLHIKTFLNRADLVCDSENNFFTKGV